MHVLTAVVLATLQSPTDTIHQTHAEAMGGEAPMHSMWTHSFESGWRLTGMAQALPITTVGIADSSSPFDRTGFYLTQPAAMINLISPQRRVVFRLTPNFEAFTIEDGETTFGGWGEGFLDARHPHTLVHEAMVSVNFFDTAVGDFSISAGKGFAPYGSDDPMARPSVKYPTNHHLSQILERFTVNGVWSNGPWSLELGVFGGSEPDGPHDFSNIGSFADSWSGRVIRRFGDLGMGGYAWELGASFAQVSEEHHEDEPHGGGGATDLFNTTLRFEKPLRPDRSFYLLGEFSRSNPAAAGGFWSFLTEASFQAGRHHPYVRFERSIRPEFDREGSAGDAFFRYDHDAEPSGATAWSIVSLGYGFTATHGSVSVRPFVEGQFFSVENERDAAPTIDLIADTSFAALTFGVRIFLGGDPMRMGSYGLLDPMIRMMP